MRKTEQLVGRQFGRLLVIDDKGTCDARRITCRCECGVVKDYYPQHVRSGRTQSCGCLRRELSREQIKHGHARTHQLTSEYLIWEGMRKRCQSPKCQAYKLYGGRGIFVCERWNSFENFLADMGRRPSATHTLDRIDNDGPYSPENCRWATRTEQARNRRSTIMIEVFGQRMSVAEAAEMHGIRTKLIHERLSYGWSPERAITTPIADRGQASRREGGGSVLTVKAC